MANVPFIFDGVKFAIFLDLDKEEISCNDIISQYTNTVVAAAFSKACDTTKNGKRRYYVPSKIKKVCANPIATISTLLPSTHQLMPSHLLFLRKFGLAVTRAMNRPRSMALHPIVITSSDFNVDDLTRLQSVSDCDFNNFPDIQTGGASPAPDYERNIIIPRNMSLDQALTCVQKHQCKMTSRLPNTRHEEQWR